LDSGSDDLIGVGEGYGDKLGASRCEDVLGVGLLVSLVLKLCRAREDRVRRQVMCSMMRAKAMALAKLPCPFLNPRHDNLQYRHSNNSPASHPLSSTPFLALQTASS
jgi:hypothetical protein